MVHLKHCAIWAGIVFSVLGWMMLNALIAPNVHWLARLCVGAALYSHGRIAYQILPTLWDMYEYDEEDEGL